MFKLTKNQIKKTCATVLESVFGDNVVLRTEDCSDLIDMHDFFGKDYTCIEFELARFKGPFPNFYGDVEMSVSTFDGKSAHIQLYCGNRCKDTEKADMLIDKFLKSTHSEVWSIDEVPEKDLGVNFQCGIEFSDLHGFASEFERALSVLKNKDFGDYVQKLLQLYEDEKLPHCANVKELSDMLCTIIEKTFEYSSCDCGDVGSSIVILNNTHVLVDLEQLELKYDFTDEQVRIHLGVEQNYLVLLWECGNYCLDTETANLIKKDFIKSETAKIWSPFMDNFESNEGLILATAIDVNETNSAIEELIRRLSLLDNEAFKNDIQPLLPFFKTIDI